MRRYVFIITILGIFTLLLIYIFQSPAPFNHKQNLSEIINNQLLTIQGQVIEETTNNNYKTLLLNNKISLICPLPCPSFLNKNISAIVKYEEYYERLKVLEIKEIKN